MTATHGPCEPHPGEFHLCLFWPLRDVVVLVAGWNVYIPFAFVLRPRSASFTLARTANFDRFCPLVLPGHIP